MENQKNALRSAVLATPEPSPATLDESVVLKFVTDFEISVPILDIPGMEMGEEEVDIDVSRDPRRFITDSSRPFFIKGTRITVHVPFSGDGELFDVRPSLFTLSPPRGRANKRELLLQYEFPNDSPPPELKQQLDRDLAEINKYLDSLRNSAIQLREQLLAIATTTWHERKTQFASRASVVSALGLPRRGSTVSPQPPSSQAAQTSTRPRSATQAIPTSRTPNLRQWHVFISHASEDKEAVAKPLADALIKRGLHVWYDEYSLSVGDSLRQKIDEGLAKSEFGIVILSKNFLGKHWPQQELNGLSAREVGGKKVILPVWHDISRDEIVQASPSLADRLGVPTSLGMDQVVTALLKAMGR